MLDLSIIIVSFNTKEILRDCLRSIIEHKPQKNSFEIIVVDNASFDGSSDMVENDFPEIILIKNQENYGFSKANNIGVKKSEGEYVLFLNSDTLIKENVFDTMIDFMKNHVDAGAATCKVVLPGGAIDDASHRGFPTPWNAFSHFSGLSKVFPKTKIFGGYSLGWHDLSITHEIDALAGAFMFVRRIAGEKAEWWDEDFFWYGEDLDFCYRLKRNGWKIYYVPTVSILHYKGVSGGLKKSSQHLTTADSETKKRATHARFEAMRIFYKKHYQKKYPSLVTYLVNIGIFLKKNLS